jgi:hypothetical protein
LLPFGAGSGANQQNRAGDGDEFPHNLRTTRSAPVC